MATGLREENSDFKPVKMHIKTDLVSHSASPEGLNKYTHTNTHTFICIYKSIRICTWVSYGQGDRGLIHGQDVTKTQKIVLDAPYFTLILRWESRVSGAIRGKEYRLHLHLGLLTIKKAVFGLPSITAG